MNSSWRTSLSLYMNREIVLSQIEAAINEFKGLFPKTDSFSNISYLIIRI